MSGAAGLAAAKRRRAAGGSSCTPGGSCSRGSIKTGSAQAEEINRRRAIEANLQAAPPEVQLLYMHERQLQKLTAEVQHLRHLLSQNEAGTNTGVSDGGGAGKIEA